MIKVEEIVKEEDLKYESALIENEKDVQVWESYFESKLNDTLPSKLSLISRAVKAVPESEELWIAFLNLVDTNYELMLTEDVKKVIDQCLTTQSKSLLIWLKIFDILIEHALDQVTYIRHKFNKCLQDLPSTEHNKIWVLFIKFGDIVGGPTGVDIYSRLMKFVSPKVLQGDQAATPVELNLTILDFIDKFVEFGDNDGVLKLYGQIVSSNEYSSLPKSQVQILFEYLDLLVENAVKEKEFESEVNKAIQKYPDQTSNLRLKLVSFYKSKKNNQVDRIRGIYQAALKDCKSLNEFEKVYNEFTLFEEREIQTYLDSNSNPNTNILSRKLSEYEKLLTDRRLLINDLQLRLDINNVDYWFSRFEIYQAQLNILIQTIANAIKSINPLKIPGTSQHKLYEIWIKYAQIYASSSDFKTADFIYGKSVQSQYPHPNELAELYISWSEMRLGSDYFKESDAIEMLEDVLYRETGNNDDEIDYVDSSIPVQKRIRKSIKLWQFYLDLVESFIESADDVIYVGKLCDAYDMLIKLKIATPKNLLNYAAFLETWGYIEKSLSIYERCLYIFKDEAIVLEIWKVYITKLKYIEHKERRKDIEERYKEVMQRRGK
ncbi:SYF1 [Candida theae]|uniref:Pre-mRNA-splicing factor SYF1 n=1 Tax=Candida theae TaxID=1198502 RepID=A0AAD5FYU8_9ASCO|nr:SYF1 [Candida theae]KAI5958630.1 SYF1 [Candida theae]